ncbi:MAG: hypothetical protein D6693_02885 [Planctomycetota bacterium]|nr:MAG: hypothetical protein D6693_02885 [Planctomycetota bacterium]
MPAACDNPSARRGFARRAALASASLILTAAAAMAIWSFVTPRPGAAPPGAAPTPELAPPTASPIGSTAATTEPPVEELLGGSMGVSEQGRLEFIDDAGRVVRELLYSRLEPVEGGRVNVSEPEGWLRLDSGAVVRLTADSAALRQPAAGAEPESGRFLGGVRLELYESDPRPAGSATIADGSPDPLVVVETDTLSFDARTGEARTDDPVRITAAGVDVRFTGFRLFIDTDRDRLALFETRGAGSGSIDPGAWTRGRSGRGEPARDRPGGGSAAAEALYLAIIEGEVTVASAGRTAHAGRVDLWARLIGGAPTARTARSVRGLLSPTRAGSAPPGAAEGASPAPGPVRFAWTDGLTVRALDEAPEELADEDARVRLTAADGGVVRLNDESAAISSVSAGVDAAVVQQRTVWRGLGPTGVVLRVGDAFEAVTGRLDADLAAGTIDAPGPGEARRLTDGGRVAWRDRASVRTARRGIADALTLESAHFFGGVEATDGVARVRGDEAHTEFTTDSDGRADLSRAVMLGGASVDAGPDGILSADRIDLEFGADAAGGATPTAATAAGSVRARREGSTLRADLAEARLRRAPGGRLIVESFTANVGVVIETADGVRASAQSVRATPEAGLADLTGEPAEVALGGSTIAGRSVRIEERARRLTVFGAGRLTRAQRDEALGYDALTLTWEDSFVYDDLTGRAEALGVCEAVGDTIAPGRDTVSASRLVIDTTPFDRRGRGEPPGLLRAVAYGGAGGENPMDPARIESRRYAPDDDAEGGLRLVTLVALDGPVIEFDAESGRLRVPRPGRLVVEDRRAETAQAAAPTAPDDVALNARGTTLAEWRGWLEISLDDGLAECRRQVRVRHRPPGSPRVADLECERLEIAFEPAGDDGASAGSAGLVWARASGAVYLAQGRRHVIADALLYDAALGMTEITSAPGNAVTLYDAGGPAPLFGESIRWDLARDRLEWRGGRAVSAPD